MAYELLRKEGLPTSYDENRTPVRADVVLSGIIYAIVIVAVSLLITIPGFSGCNKKVFVFLRTACSLFIGASILVTNFGYEWHYGVIDTKTQYKAFTANDINATIGIKIGLRGINITLKGTPEDQLGETINYNEHFPWAWEQSSFGFAGPFSLAYRDAKTRGVPLPIMWVAEYFTFDAGDLRFSRFYRRAGYYTHIMLWTAFPLWVVTNIFFVMLLEYGCFCLALTGLFMLLGNSIYAAEIGTNVLSIHFGDVILTTSFGWCFWLCLGTGLFCIILAIVSYISLLRAPGNVASFFNVNVLENYRPVVEREHTGEQQTEGQQLDRTSSAANRWKHRLNSVRKPVRKDLPNEDGPFRPPSVHDYTPVIEEQNADAEETV